MLARRIIPCLDVRDGVVVKGRQYKDHQIVGDIVTLAERYVNEGADELVFYHITASINPSETYLNWISKIAAVINIPFCVAGGIRSIKMAEECLNAGADKISINSPALEDPDLISRLASRFGQQCVVVGIDSYSDGHNSYVQQYTGCSDSMRQTRYTTIDWAKEVVSRGAGEIVLNCMNQDGMRNGFDIQQLKTVAASVEVPVIASGGAGKPEDFVSLFQETVCTGGLAASIFHRRFTSIQEIKRVLSQAKIEVRDDN